MKKLALIIIALTAFSASAKVSNNIEKNKILGGLGACQSIYANYDDLEKSEEARIARDSVMSITDYNSDINIKYMRLMRATTGKDNALKKCNSYIDSAYKIINTEK
ncbi:TPA: hypothetical protein ACX6Q6_003026 [Photobacterium damselae]